MRHFYTSQARSTVLDRLNVSGVVGLAHGGIKSYIAELEEMLPTVAIIEAVTKYVNAALFGVSDYESTLSRDLLVQPVAPKDATGSFRISKDAKPPRALLRNPRIPHSALEFRQRAWALGRTNVAAMLAELALRHATEISDRFPDGTFVRGPVTPSDMLFASNLDRIDEPTPLVEQLAQVVDGCAQGDPEWGYETGLIVLDAFADLSRRWLADTEYRPFAAHKAPGRYGDEELDRWTAETGVTGVLLLTNETTGKQHVLDEFRRQFWTADPVPDATADWETPPHVGAPGQTPDDERYIQAAQELLNETGSRIAEFDGGLLAVARTAATHAAEASEQAHRDAVQQRLSVS